MGPLFRSCSISGCMVRSTISPIARAYLVERLPARRDSRSQPVACDEGRRIADFNRAASGGPAGGFNEEARSDQLTRLAHRNPHSPRARSVRPSLRESRSALFSAVRFQGPRTRGNHDQSIFTFSFSSSAPHTTDKPERLSSTLKPMSVGPVN